MTSCSKAIVLLMDRSGSIDTEDWIHQVRSTANALEDPEVMKLIIKNGGIAFNAMWFNTYVSSMVDWRILSTEAEIRAFASELRDYVDERTPQNRGTGRPTNMSFALDQAVRSLEKDLPQACTGARQIIDITTDGDPDSLTRTHASSKEAASKSITINGIAIGGSAAFVALDEFVTTKQTGGKTFQADWDNFGEIIKQKLLMELLADAGIGQRRFAYAPASLDTVSASVVTGNHTPESGVRAAA